MFKRSHLLIGARLAALLLCGCLFITGCCPNCPSGGGTTGNTVAGPKPGVGMGPHNYPPDWQVSLMNGKSTDVVVATDQIITAGNSTPGYADAYLYRGLAKFFQGDLQGSQADLLVANNLKDGFSPDYAKQEQVLLYRGLMVVSAKLGQMDSAKSYHDQAVALSPDQADSIGRELNSQALMLTQLAP